MAQSFHVIVAHDLNRGIGIDNKIPWHLPVDMAYFKKTTTTATKGKQNAVIMGRKTWESIPEKFRPLPGRINIVLSKSVTEIDGALVAHSFDNALQQCEQDDGIDQVFVIGGSQIYDIAIQHKQCDTLYVTKVFKRFDCDAYFSEYKSIFQCTYASNIWVNKNGNCAFYQYKKLE